MCGDLLDPITRRQRVIGPKLLDEATISWSPRISSDNAIKGQVATPKALQANSNRHQPLTHVAQRSPPPEPRTIPSQKGDLPQNSEGRVMSNRATNPRDWCSGNIIAFQAIARGSIPLLRIFCPPPPRRRKKERRGDEERGEEEGKVQFMPCMAQEDTYEARLMV